MLIAVKFAALVALSLFLCLALAYAAASDELPPPVPSVQGVLFAQAIFQNGTAIQNSSLVVVATSNGSQTIYRLITDSAGRFVLSLSPSKYDLDSLLEYPGAPGTDFASTSSVDLASGGNATLIFYPAGSLAGTTAYNGSPVSSARVRVNCPSSSFDYSRINGGTEVQSGDAGDFLFSALPVGTCIVSASTDSLAGSSEVQIAEGQTNSVTIEMVSKAVAPVQAGNAAQPGQPLPPGNAAQQDYLPLAVAAAAILAAAYLFTMYLQEKGKRQAQKPSSDYGTKETKRKQQKDEEESGISSKLSDPKVKAIIATLSDREAEIVRFLFKNNGRAKRSTMQHKLLIPKTSLLRNLRSLERKKIVKLTPFGRNLLAEIEDWVRK